MSEQSQGPGWWIASDGRWYPPETHPDYRPPAPSPPTEATSVENGGTSRAEADRRRISQAATDERPTGRVGGERGTRRAEAAAEKARTKAMRPWYRKKRFIVPLAVAALAVVIAAGKGDDDPADRVTAGSGSNGGDESRLFPGRPDVKRNDKEREVSQAAELSGFTATVTSASFQQQLSQFERDGYLVAEVTLLNRDDRAQSYNPFHWKLITPGGQIIDPTFTTVDQLGSGDLVKGGTSQARSRGVWGGRRATSTSYLTRLTSLTTPAPCGR